MKVDIGEIATIFAVASITMVTIVMLKGEGTEIAAAGLGGLVGYLTKSAQEPAPPT
jgi:hypothetical protein